MRCRDNLLASIGRCSYLFKFALVSTLRWDGINFFRITQKLACFVQDRREEWGDISWKQIAEVNDDAIDPDKG